MELLTFPEHYRVRWNEEHETVCWPRRNRPTKNPPQAPRATSVSRKTSAHGINATTTPRESRIFDSPRSVPLLSTGALVLFHVFELRSENGSRA